MSMCFDCLFVFWVFFLLHLLSVLFLAVGVALVLSLEGAFSKALRMNCSNGNTNTACAVISYAIQSTPSLLRHNHFFSVVRPPSLSASSSFMCGVTITVDLSCVYCCDVKRKSAEVSA